ncbi:hypothetical protein [Actinomadura alba]|uniref:Integral membrane protein n=1 Tax=Actinomadura alba TaxID=406431 RepID=A0ABR7LRS3_9ACTN|nr:hypothetical protein [Actinomadura alba]MBC6467294.1 hypothetical protein [Actinomadura alba]
MTAAMPPGALRGLPAPGDPDAGDSLEALTRRMEELCAGAVDPFEVAAGLEADGLNDEGAGQYGYPHVFALAEDLYERTERRPATPEALPNPWSGEVWRQLLRGMLFGLPGLCYATATPALTRPGGSVVLMLSLLLSWSASQGVAYLAYVRMGRGDRPAAARVMRHGLTATGVVAVPVIVATAVLLDAGGAATALAVGQCVYLLAATVALVIGAEPWLLLALLPGAVASTVQLAAGGPVRPVLWIAWAVTITATVCLAVARTAGPGSAGGDTAGGRVDRSDAAMALPYALFGLLSGGMLTFPTVSTLLGRSEPTAATSVAVLALSLSMGFAEWILVSYRRRMHRTLLGHSSVRGFALAARATLAAAVAAYLVVLTALAVAIAGLAGLNGDLLRDSAGPATTTWTAGGYLGLGGAFFVALLLQSCGRIRAVLAGCASALAAETVASHAANPWVVQFVVACGLLVALLTYAFVVLGRATSHR